MTHTPEVLHVDLPKVSFFVITRPRYFMSTARKIVVFGGVVWAGLLVWGSSKEGRRRRESRDQLSRGFVSPSGATPNGPKRSSAE